jgi:hypothetical protein
VFCEAEIRDGERLIAKASGTFKYLKSPILRRSYAECAGKYRLGYFLTEEDEYLSPNCTGGEPRVEITSQCFRFEDFTCSDLKPKILVKNHFLSLGPLYARAHE